MDESLFTDEPVPQENLFTDEPMPEPKTAMGFIKNIGSDIKDMAKGGLDLGYRAARSAATYPFEQMSGVPFQDTNAAKELGPVITGLPGALIDEGKRVGAGELLTGNFGEAANKFGNAVYDKPVTTALDVLPAIGSAGKALGFGGKVARGTEMAAKAGSMADDVARMASETPTTSVPLGNTFQETVKNLGQKLPTEIKQPLKEVGQLLESKYSQIAKKPGWADTVGSYANEHAQNMALKTAGASPAQIRKIGIDESRALADRMLEKGMVSGKVGPQGMEKMVSEAHSTAGSTIGGIRKIASKRGAVHNMDDVVTRIQSNLDKKYTEGIDSSQKGIYMKALAELKKTEPTAEAVSKKITELFQKARGLDRLKQPSGAIADVARELRTLNEDLMHKFLSPKELETYQSALDEFGAMTQIKEFVKRRNSMEAGGRLGPGAGISRMMAQKFLDSIGYRAEAQIAKKISKWVSENPEAASSPKAIFQKYIDEAVEAMDEMGEASQ
jgi:hypothetical protein